MVPKFQNYNGLAQFCCCFFLTWPIIDNFELDPHREIPKLASSIEQLLIKQIKKFVAYQVNLFRLPTIFKR